MKDRILIIEDETAIRSILEELLTDAGYEIETAGDGLEGITKFREQSFSLVLLDIMMPKIDGYVVCEMIRRESDVPVIMLTALDEEEAQVRAFELKADDYITKPFSVKLVLMRVEAVLRRAMIARAESVYLLCDHTKMGKNALHRICGPERFTALITDRKPPASILEQLLKQEIEVLY